jgi:CRISPR-associated exonuclease Cas4
MSGDQPMIGALDTGRDREPIAISALQHAVYCLRQAALIHLEQQWAENRFTAEGRIAHETTSLPGQRHVRGVRRVHALPLASQTLGIAGVGDIVEFRREGTAKSAPEIAYPVEMKRGQPKLHRADEVQLAAQAMCLEEMTGHPVPFGALYYVQTRRRVEVPIDEELRALTILTIQAMHGLFETRVTPAAVWKTDRCRACSLIEICRPKLQKTAVLDWRARMVDATITTNQSDET